MNKITNNTNESIDFEFLTKIIKSNLSKIHLGIPIPQCQEFCQSAKKIIVKKGKCKIYMSASDYIEIHNDFPITKCDKPNIDIKCDFCYMIDNPYNKMKLYIFKSV
jgi:hypothetical protein